MNNAVNIAKYIIEYHNTNKLSIDKLRLHKILYLLQGFSLSFDGEVAFNDPIEAWQYGIIVPNVYHKITSSNNIVDLKDFSDYSTDDIPNTIKDLINKICKTSGKYSSWNLVQETHDNLWEKVYNRNNKVFSIKEIQEYFNKMIVLDHAENFLKRFKADFDYLKDA